MQQRYAIGEHEFDTLEELAHWLSEHTSGGLAVRAVRAFSAEELTTFSEAFTEECKKTSIRRSNRERIRVLQKELRDLRADRSILDTASARETEIVAEIKTIENELKKDFESRA